MSRSKKFQSALAILATMMAPFAALEFWAYTTNRQLTRNPFKEGIPYGLSFRKKSETSIFGIASMRLPLPGGFIAIIIIIRIKSIETPSIKISPPFQARICPDSIPKEQPALRFGFLAVQPWRIGGCRFPDNCKSDNPIAHIAWSARAWSQFWNRLFLFIHGTVAVFGSSAPVPRKRTS